MALVPAPVDLRVEYEHQPIGLDERRPRFSWRTPRGAVSQVAYQIQVQRIAGTDGYWDSGRVVSASSVLVPYGGRDLHAFGSYRWRVRYWGGEDEAGGWATGNWSMGPLREVDWSTARWITAGDAPPRELRPAPLLRREFDRGGSQVTSATLFLCGLGYAECHLNGQPVTSAVLQPAPTNYDETVLYNTYDVTALVQRGRNCLAVELGRGRFADLTPSVWNWHVAPWVRQPQLRALLRIEAADGGVELVASDDEWRWMAGPTVTDSLFRGEAYDARLAIPGWTDARFDDREWSRVAVVDAPSGRLKSQRVEPIQVVESVAPVSTTSLRPGVTIFDFGRQIAGRSKVTGTHLEPGTRAHVTHAEKRSDSGRPVIEQRHIEDPIQTDTLVSSGDSISFESRFSYKGFRFVEVESECPSAKWDVRADVIHTSVASTGTFECSNDSLNLIHQASRSSILSNLHGIPTDTPVYEKNGWTADAHLSMEAAIANFDMARLYTKWLDDFADSQRADGELPPIVPTSGAPGWGYSDSNVGIIAPQPSWDVAYPEVAWGMWKYYGDRRILERHLGGFLNYLDYIEGHLDGFIFRGGLGDWWPPDHSARNREDADLHQTAYVARWTELTTSIAHVLGDAKAAARCHELRANIADAFHRTFFDPQRGFYAAQPGGPFRQAANAVPLGLGLVPEKLVGPIVDAISDDLRQRGSHPDTGVIGIKHLLHVLSAHGRHDLAVKLVTVSGFPGFLRWFDDGVVSLHEGWDDDARSHNHHYFASVDQWLYERVLGIRPSESGYGAVHIQPMSSPLVTWARGHVTTPHGPVDIAWQQRSSGIHLTMTIPPGIEAVIASAQTLAATFGPGTYDLFLTPDEQHRPRLGDEPRS